LCCLMPELGRINTRLYFELLNGVNGRKSDVSIEIGIGIDDTIKSEIVEHDALAGSRDGLAGTFATFA